jgi:putative ABC transport system permease protein
MYILKNALKSISRSKGRNILIGIIVVVIAISSCVSLSIKNAAAKAKEEGLNSLSITGQISLDRQKIITKTQADGTDPRTAMQSYPDPTLTELTKYSAATSVKSFYYSMTSSISASGTLEPVDTSATTSSATNNQQSRPQTVNGPPGGMGSQGDFSVTGYSALSAMTSFVNGTNKITSGTIFDESTSELICIISSELATLNNLKVGDKITLANPNVDTETYEFTILGIYTNTSTTEASTNMRFSTSQDPANQIYTSFNTLKAVTEKSTSVATTSTDSNTGRTNTTALRNQVAGTYVFADATSFEAFKTEVTALGLGEYYTVSSSDVSNYEASLVPLNNLNSFATTLLLIILLIGGIILIVFNMFNIRERKFEVGVLTAIGMKKGKVAAQFIAELFVITFLSILLGTVIGSIISVPTANSMLQSQVSAQQTQSQQQDQNFGRGNPRQNIQQGGIPNRDFRSQAVNYISNINAAINFKVLLQLLGIGILLTIISSLAAVVFVLRFEPLKILSERT